jgi:hypothetical protein
MPLPLLVTTLLPLVGKVLDKVIPNAEEREKAKAEIALRIAENEMELLKTLAEVDKGQLEINKMEAQSAHFYVAGARPTVLWICNIALAWMYILQPMIQTILYWCGKVPTPGQLDTAGIMGLTASILGFGGMRMFESIKGVERSNLKEF